VLRIKRRFFFTAKVLCLTIVFVEMLKKGAEATQMFGGGL
jgi:hypothetical protein